MKALLWLAVRVYPPHWRARYGEEFASLLEDTGPRWRDVWDVACAALSMRSRQWGFRTLVGLAAAGLAGGVVVAYRAPRTYTAKAVLAIPVRQPSAGNPVPELVRRMQNETLARTHLADIIHAFDLYPEERLHQPMEDVVDQMRKAIKVKVAGSGDVANGCTYEFSYRDPVLARRVVEELTRRAAGLHNRSAAARTAPTVSNWRVKDAELEGPAQWMMVSAGLLLGIGLGTLLWASRQWPLTVSCVLSLPLLTWAVLEIPNRFTSEAVVFIRGGSATEARIENAKRNLTYWLDEEHRDRIERIVSSVQVEKPARHDNSLVIRYSAGSGKEAQYVVRAMLSALATEFKSPGRPVRDARVVPWAGAWRNEGELRASVSRNTQPAERKGRVPEWMWRRGSTPEATRPGPAQEVVSDGVEFLSPASRPEEPDPVDWRVPIGVGLGVGLPLGVGAGRARRRRRALPPATA
jgi:hypothetical protein